MKNKDSITYALYFPFLSDMSCKTFSYNSGYILMTPGFLKVSYQRFLPYYI